MSFLNRLFGKIRKQSNILGKSGWKLPEGWTETKVSDNVYVHHMPKNQMDQWKAERHKKDKVDELIKRNGFHNCYNGNEGYIYYVEDGHLCEMYYEASGSDKFDIALWSLDLRKWLRPEGELIPKEKQVDILNQLRMWFKEQKLRTHIDLPQKVEFEDKACVWKGCNERRMKGSAYCRIHYDLNLLVD